MRNWAEQTRNYSTLSSYMLPDKSVLIIDITIPGAFTFFLLSNPVEKKMYRGRHLNLLVCLDKFLKDQRTKLKQLKGVVLLEGGGTFSAVRGAAAILNALHLAAMVPVWGVDIRKFSNDYQKIFIAVSRHFHQLKKTGLIKPVYTGEPHITTNLRIGTNSTNPRIRKFVKIRNS